MPRAAAIIFQNDCVALIERHRSGLRYFLFPGGGVDAGETLEEAVMREVREELGLIVTVGPLVAEVTFSQADPTRRQQFYFLAEAAGGEFGTGQGLEMRGAEPLEHGTYAPVWMPLADLGTHSARPQLLIDLLPTLRGGWSEPPLKIRDDGNA